MDLSRRCLPMLDAHPRRRTCAPINPLSRDPLPAPASRPPGWIGAGRCNDDNNNNNDIGGEIGAKGKRQTRATETKEGRTEADPTVRDARIYVPSRTRRGFYRNKI